jgi:branched-chain amino acid transport system permease protein
MILAICAALAALPLLGSQGLVTSFTYIGIDCLLAIGLVLLTGVAGLTSFGQAAFCGVSAYTSAKLTTAYGWSPLQSLPVSLAVTAAAAMALGAITVRLAGHYLVLGTLAWGTAIFYVLGNVPGLGGFNGFTGLPPISLGPLVLDTPAPVYLLVWILAGLAFLMASNLLDSRAGRAMRSLPARVMAESLGIPTAAFKTQVFVIAAVLAGLAGWLGAYQIRVVNPGPFSIRVSVDDLFMVVIGGIGSLGGALIGPMIFELLQDWLRGFLPWLIGRAGSFEVAVFGLLVMLLLQTASSGLMPLLSRFLPARPARKIQAEAASLPMRVQPQAGGVLLQVTGLVKRFGGLTAVNQVTLELRAGQILAVIGPNGAGKSTLFNLLTGVAAADAGEIHLDGKRIERLSSRQIAALGVARTFQHVLLRPGMSVLENVALGAHRRGRAGALAAILRLDRREEASLLREAQLQLDRVGIGHLAALPAASLALGQQRILEIARALAADPALLLLDEPAAGLRHQEKQTLSALLADLRAQGLSILLVEHDMSFVMGLVDRIVVMEFGSRIAEGTPEAIRRDPLVLQAYLGVPEPAT